MKTDSKKEETSGELMEKILKQNKNKGKEGERKGDDQEFEIGTLSL